MGISAGAVGWAAGGSVGTGVVVWACAAELCSAATTSNAAGSMAVPVGRAECRWCRKIVSCKGH